MRDLGNLAPVREVLAWLDQQKASIAAPAESVRLITAVRAQLEQAIAAAEHAELDGGLSVPEYAKLAGLTEHAVYKRIARGSLPAKRLGSRRLIRIDPRAA